MAYEKPIGSHQGTYLLPPTRLQPPLPQTGAHNPRSKLASQISAKESAAL